MAFCKLVKKNPTQERNGILTQAPLEKEPEGSLRYNMQCFLVICNLKAERLMEINEPGRREENQGQAIQKPCPSEKEWIGNVVACSILLLSHLSRFLRGELAPCHSRFHVLAWLGSQSQFLCNVTLSKSKSWEEPETLDKWQVCLKVAGPGIAAEIR